MHHNPHLSAISIYEIELGAFRAGRLSDIAALQIDFTILPFTEAVARRAAMLDADLIRQSASKTASLLLPASCTICLSCRSMYDTLIVSRDCNWSIPRACRDSKSNAHRLVASCLKFYFFALFCTPRHKCLDILPLRLHIAAV